MDVAQAQGRHAFWNKPLLRNHPLRTLPIQLGGQRIGFGGLFLGQDSNPVMTNPLLPPNRLDGLTIKAIQNRILVAPPIARIPARLAQIEPRLQSVDPFDRAVGQMRAATSSLPALSAGEADLLSQISQDPSMDELADLATIDGFFQNQSGDQLSKKELYTNLTLDVCTALKNPRSLGLGAFGSDTPRGLGQVMAAFLLTQPTRGMNAWAGTQAPNATSDEIGAITGNPFYCETPASWPYPNDVHVDWPTYFAINATQPWGAVKTQVYNAITAMQVMAAYPFPPPIDKYVYEFWVTANSDLQQIAATPTPVDPQVVEYWVTLFTVSNYSAMTTQIEAILKKKEKNAKRKALMDVIGLAVASIVVMFLLPAIIAAAISVIKTVITTYTQIQQQKAAAKQLNDTSKMFAADAPAFSAKVDAASQLMDAEAAAQAAAGTPSPDLQAAIQQVKDNTPFTVSTPVLIGGGVAAAGLAVFLIFK